MAEARVPLQNTVRTGGGEPVDWTVNPDGQYPMALVEIKNVQLDHTKFPGGKITPGYKFMFQGKDDPNFIASIDCNAIIGGARAKLPKLVRNMSGNTLTEEIQENADHFFNFMVGLLHKWYIVPVEKVTWEKEGEAHSMNKVADVSVIPHPQGHEWPKGEKRPFVRKERREAKATSSAGVTGFESFADKGAEKAMPHMYRIKFSEEKAIYDQQHAFVAQRGGKFSHTSGNHHFAEKVDQLEPFYVGEWKEPESKVESELAKEDVSFDEDDIPF